jgi:hypothetical protein
MELEVLDIYGASRQIVVPNEIVKVDDLRVALFSQHDMLPEGFVFSYNGVPLDEDSAIPLTPDSEKHPFVMLDSAQFPQKAFAAVDNAFQFGVTRYAHYFQKPDPLESEEARRRRPLSHAIGDLIREVLGLRRGEEPGNFEEDVQRMMRLGQLGDDF